jgi:hypothetical protein
MHACRYDEKMYDIPNPDFPEVKQPCCRHFGYGQDSWEIHTCVQIVTCPLPLTPTNPLTPFRARTLPSAPCTAPRRCCR